MTQFNFTTNIEKRMPDTGEVFCIDRMTSDYAEQHPFDVDGFIESVYQKYIQMAEDDSFCKKWVKTREELRRLWNAVLSTTNPCGDPSIYPNQNDTQPALMEVWLKAGNYWHNGFRQGDTLPDMVPMCKITRLNDGTWIALFPKDKHLLMTTDSTDETDNIEPVRNQSEPRQLDLFAMQARPQRRRRASKPAPSVAAAQPLTVAVAVAAASPAVSPSDELQGLKNVGKALAIVIGLSAVLVLLWQTGLIIPLGLIGLATSGFLK